MLVYYLTSKQYVTQVQWVNVTPYNTNEGIAVYSQNLVNS